MSPQVSLYNPRATPPEQLEALLVGRDALLKELLDNLREQARGQTRQHWLIRGPRGMGKTHLTGIIHHRVRSDPELSGVYLPLWLGEADVYEVYSPATLLERIAERLIEAVPEAKLGEALRDLQGAGDEEGLFQEISEQLSEEARRQGKILLVLMENLDALLEGFAPKERKAQLRQLRSLLLHDSHFLFISTTPTKYMPMLTNPKEPLYNQFKERSLKPLTVKEVGTVFARLTALTERKGMEGLLGDAPDAALRRKVIHQLTGGLPRSVVMAFEVMRDKAGIQPLVEDLRALLDAQTAYFEARLRQLAPRERTIVTAMALAPKNLTLKEIAERSRLPERSLSTLMSRLLQDGHVEVSSGEGGKGTIYGLSEGLFRLWYQYRKGRLLLEPLVKLLAYLYDAAELRDTVSLLKEHITQSKEGAAYSAKLALLQVEEALRLATSEEGQRDKDQLWKECLDDVQAANVSKIRAELIKLIEQSLDPASFESANRPSADDYEALVKHVLDAAAVLPEPAGQACIYVLILQTFKIGHVHPQHSVEFLKDLTHLLDERTYSAARKCIWPVHFFLTSRLERLGQYQAALDHAEEALTHSKGDDPYGKHLLPPESILWLRAELLANLGRTQEALPEYERFIREATTVGSPTLIDGAIRALDGLARLQETAGVSLKEKLETARETIRLTSKSTEEHHRRILGHAKFRLISLKSQQGTVPVDELLQALSAWLLEFPEHPLLDTAQKIHQVLETLQSTLTEKDPKIAAEQFLANPRFFYTYLGAMQLRQWLSTLDEAGLDPKQAESIKLHCVVASALETASLDKPGASSHLKQALGQIPPELHQLVEELIEAEQQHRKAAARPSSSPGRRKSVS